MAEDDASHSRNRQKPHPVWKFLDYVKQGVKNAVHRCSFCALEKEGISATRWAVHILGKAIGNSTTAGIQICSGGPDKKAFKAAKDELEQYVKGRDKKKEETQQLANALSDRVRLQNEAAMAALMPQSTQHQSQPVLSGNLQQTTLPFGSATKRVVQDNEASSSTKKPKVDETLRQNHAVADAAVARMFYETGMPFEPVEHEAFVNMVDVLANLLDPKKGVYKPPSRHDLSNSLLTEAVSIVLLMCCSF